MAETPTQSTAGVLQLDFDLPPNRPLFLNDLDHVFGTMHQMLVDLHWLAIQHGADREGGRDGIGLVDVLVIEMHSPLTLLLGMKRLPKEVVRAFVYLLEHAMFYREEKSVRQARAASEWEDVYAKRLKNINTAIGIATRNANKELWAGMMDQMVSNVAKLERGDLRLRKVHRDDDRDE